MPTKCCHDCCSDGRVDLIESSFPEETVARIRLLSGMNAFHNGDLRLARQCVADFLEEQARHEESSQQRRGWRRLANMLSDVLAIQQDKEKGVLGPQAPLHDDSGFGRFLRFASHVRDRLVGCPIELLPLYAALAIVHNELTGPPGAASVPVCHQLQGGLKHLGFDSEVIAASAMLQRDGDEEAEDVGKHGTRTRPARRRQHRWTRRGLVVILRSTGRSDDRAITIPANGREGQPGLQLSGSTTSCKPGAPARGERDWHLQQDTSSHRMGPPAAVDTSAHPHTGQ